MIGVLLGDFVTTADWEGIAGEVVVMASDDEVVVDCDVGAGAEGITDNVMIFKLGGDLLKVCAISKHPLH